jgi:homoserine O-acetyltransferase/O-succinyltransferase
MGGMAVLEWPLCTPPGYVRNIVPIATAARHSAWCISWGEAQRQSIYSDPAYEDGYYDVQKQPRTGLAAARMSALLTYRSRDSFEQRFGRKAQVDRAGQGLISPQPDYSAVDVHNEGHRASRTESRREGSHAQQEPTKNNIPRTFSAQGYLRYQGDKFVARFDANCYIHITRKMDTHDLARGRSGPVEEGEESAAVLGRVMAQVPKAMVIGIQTDGLFMPSEQREIAAHISNSTLVMIDSPDGHDGFLLEFEAINRHVLEFLREVHPRLYVGWHAGEADFSIGKTSVFGEAESGVDVIRW